MIYTDRDIRQAINVDRVSIDPLDPAMIQPCSIDLRLGHEFRIFENHRYTHIDPRKEQIGLTRLVAPEKEEPFTLHPGEFILGCTLETIAIKAADIAGRLEGKSSLGRLGLLVHSTAGWVDPGFHGQLTLELSNVATLPIDLWPEMKIGQLCLLACQSPVEYMYGDPVYGSRYQAQLGPTPSRGV